MYVCMFLSMFVRCAFLWIMNAYILVHAYTQECVYALYTPECVYAFRCTLKIPCLNFFIGSQLIWTSWYGCTRAHTHTHVHIYVCVCVYIYIYIHIHIYICNRMYTCGMIPKFSLWALADTDLSTRIYIYIYIYIYIHIHTYIYTCVA